MALIKNPEDLKHLREAGRRLAEVMRRLVKEVRPGASARTLDTHIWRLRSKLGETGDRIQTVGKNGYRFNS